MPELVKLGRELKDGGLTIVGINFDHDLDKARAAIAKHALPWPQVFAGEAAKGDADLWRDVSGIDGLPRILLIDREGVLRADTRPHELRQRVLELLD